VDFPQAVLPTIPTLLPPSILKERFFNLNGNLG
jgi:hypothetical protein